MGEVETKSSRNLLRGPGLSSTKGLVSTKGDIKKIPPVPLWILQRYSQREKAHKDSDNSNLTNSTRSRKLNTQQGIERIKDQANLKGWDNELEQLLFGSRVEIEISYADKDKEFTFDYYDTSVDGRTLYISNDRRIGEVAIALENGATIQASSDTHGVAIYYDKRGQRNFLFVDMPNRVIVKCSLEDCDWQEIKEEVRRAREKAKELGLAKGELPQGNDVVVANNTFCPQVQEFVDRLKH